VSSLSPASDTTPAELTEPLVSALRLHTNAPERCWFAIWEGYGGLGHDVLRAPKFDVPNRSYPS
jgi:hypothetical protein